MLQTPLDAIRRDIDRCYFATCFEMESGLTLGISTQEFANDQQAISAAFGQVLGIVSNGQRGARNEAIRSALKAFRELILETDRSTFFVLVPGGNDTVAVAVGVPKDVKIGYARVGINKHLDELIHEIRELV